MPSTFFKPRKISQLDYKADSKVCIVGKIIDADNNIFIVDDGTSKAEIIFEGEIEKEKIYRIFCSVANETLKVEVIQELKDVDINIFRKVEDLYEKAGF